MELKFNLNGRRMLSALLLLAAFIVPNGLKAEITYSFMGKTLHISGDESSTTLDNTVILNRLTPSEIRNMEVVYVSGFSRIENHTFAGFANVKKISVYGGNTVVNVGCGAFGSFVEDLELNCYFQFDRTYDQGSFYNIFTSVNGSSAVKKVSWVGQAPAGAFKGCKNIVSIPTINADNRPVDETTFTECTSLKDINVDFTFCGYKNEFTESTSIGRLFPTVESVHIVGELKVGDSQISSYAFAKMKKLKEVYIPSSSSKDRIAATAFDGCENEIAIKYEDELANMTYADWWNSVKDKASTMETVFVPNNDVASHEIGALFPKMKKVVISLNVTQLGYRFCYNCQTLQDVTIPKSIQTIGNTAFWGCKNARVTFEPSASLSKTYTESQNLALAFADVQDITIVRYATVGAFAFFGLSTLQCLTLGEEVKINNYAFGNTNISELNLPKVVTINGSPFNTVDYLAFNSNQLLGDLTYTTNLTSDLPQKFGTIRSLYFDYDVTKIGSHRLTRIPSLEKVVISGSVTSIGEGAFDGCANLEEVVIGSGVTSMTNSFRNCQNLTNVTVNSNSLMASTYFVASTFPNTKKLVIGDDVKTIGSNCCTGVSLDELKLPSSLTSIGAYAFNHQSAIGTITLPATLNRIDEYAFYGCSNINFTELPSSLSTIGNHAFDGCRNITTLKFNNNSFIANSTFTEGDNVTTRFPYLENVTLSNVSTIPQYAFSGSSALTSVTFNGVTLPSIYDNSFDGCSNIAEVKYPFAESTISLATWKELNRLFPAASAQKLYVPNDNISNASGLTTEKNNLAALYPSVTEVTFGPYVTTIGNYLMSHASYLEVANIGRNVKNINGYAFAQDSKLTTVNYLGDESLMAIHEDAFVGCTLMGVVSFHNWIESFPNRNDVKELLIPNDNIADYEWDGLYNIATFFPNVEKVVFGPEVTRIHDNCLKGARNLKEVEFNEGLEYIGLNAIDDSRLLTSITIPSTVEEMDDYAIVLRGQDVGVTFKTLAFLNASKSNEFVKIYPATYSDGNGESVPSHVSFNFEGVQTIPSFAFQNLEALTNVNLGTTALIGTCAFKGCTNLESVEISENVTYLDLNAFAGMKGKVTLLGANYRGGSFTDCFGNDVTEVVYGDDITSISFPANYPSLQKLTIGANVQTISGFSQCANLKSVTINSNSFAANANGEGTSNLSAYFPYIKEVSFGDCVQELGANILYGNNTVESVTFSGYNVSVGASAFEGCEQLTAVNGRMTTIGNNAFRNCPKLVKAGDSDMVRELGVNAFQGCASLEAYNMHIGCNINTEGGLSNAFDGCVKLKTFTVTGSQKEAEGTPSIEGINFFGGVNLANATLIVDKYFYNAFQNAPVWKDFGNMGTTWYEVFADAIPYNSEYPNYSSEITYSRNFKNTEWQALYIPFSLAYEDWKDDFDIAYVNDVHQLDTDDDGEIDMTVLETIKLKSDVTKPSEPYIIRAHSVGKKTIHHVGAQYILPSEVTTFDVSSRNTIFNFTGTYSGVSGAEMLEKGYYAFGGGSLIQADSADADLLPCRWYMEVVDRNNNPQPSLGKVRVVVRGEDDTTDIKTLVMGNSDEASDNAIFDLSGRKVSNAQKGIYIKNGKKIVVR